MSLLRRGSHPLISLCGSPISLLPRGDQDVPPIVRTSASAISEIDNPAEPALSHKFEFSDEDETRRPMRSNWTSVLSELAARSLLHLRLCTADDATTLARVEKIVYPDAWTEDYFRELLSKPNVRSLLVESDQLVAFLIWKNQPEGWTEVINIASLRRGEGIGPLLLRAMIGIVDFLPADRLRLKVRASNRYAIDFYEFLGFVHDANGDFLWPNGERGIVMKADVARVVFALRYRSKARDEALAAP